MIRELRGEDVKTVSEMHFREINNSFLCSLGQEFLCELYEGILNSENVSSYVFEENSNVAGFVSGTVDYPLFFRSILTSKWRKLLPILVKRITLRPKVLLHSIETIFYSKKADVSAEAEVLSIVVRREHRGKKVGSRLFDHLLSELAKKKRS